MKRTIPTADVGDRCCDWLRKRHPSKTAAHVAADTGIKEATIAKMLEQNRLPGGANLAVMIDVYGPVFLAAVLPVSLPWLDSLVKAQGLDEILAEVDELKARLDRFSLK